MCAFARDSARPSGIAPQSFMRARRADERFGHRSPASATPEASPDIYELEADRVAQRVAATANPMAPATPLPTAAFSGKSAQSGNVGPSSVRCAVRSPGRPLDVTSREDMESRFGHDFSRVRVHLGPEAASAARDMGALAYTLGHDIVFGAGQYAPGTSTGNRLLAHELAHVLQQGRGTVAPGIQLKPAPKRAAFQDCTPSNTLSGTPQKDVGRSLDLARRFVNGAISKLGIDPDTQPKSDSYRVALERHFLSPITAQRIDIRRNFRAILDKLKPEEIRCVATDADVDYCFSSPDAQVMAAFMRTGQAFLCLGFWTMDSKCQAMTLIHEAAHAVNIGMSTHPPYRGSPEYPSGGGPPGKGETAKMRLDNPDAYAYFAAHVWRDIDSKCAAHAEVIRIKASAPAATPPEE